MQTVIPVNYFATVIKSGKHFFKVGATVQIMREGKDRYGIFYIAKSDVGSWQWMREGEISKKSNN